MIYLKAVSYTHLYDNIGGLSPKRDGYQFNGWYTNPTGGVQVYDANGYRVNNTRCV